MVYLGKNRRARISKKAAKAQKKHDFEVNKNTQFKEEEKKIEVHGKFSIPKIVTVRNFAQILNIPVTKVIEKLMQNGVLASINESIDFDTATIIADEFGAELVPITEEKKKEGLKHENLKPRPAVVVVLGHVDHGKTTLLDSIRKSDVVSGESGGITQHIGAYQVNWKDKKNKITPITFLDTPGHEAFSTMRAHGANITDVAILVVAADDGVKPQTREAISHIKSANVPVIVAINKIDKPEANPDRVKKELGDLGLVSEEWGGDTIMIPVSAKQGKGIDKLLDMLLVLVDMQNLRSQYDGKVEGVVIESHMQAGIGPVATILINHGTLQKGDVLVIGGSTTCKVRLMENYLGTRIAKATPSMPVKIAGLSKVPNFGERVIQVDAERDAKNIVNINVLKTKSFSIYDVSQAIKSGDLKELNIIIKADTQGSLEAIKNTLVQLSNDKVKVKILLSGIGVVTENDISMAASGGNTFVMGFKVTIPENVKESAKEKNVTLKSYDIIYRLIEDIQAVVSGLVEPEIVETIIGKVQVLKVFYKNVDRKLIGGKVIDGKFVEGEKVKIFHSGEEIGEGKVASLQIGEIKTNEVENGIECGIAIVTKHTIKPKDLLEEFKIEKV